MEDWNEKLYSLFLKERSLPASDLLSAISLEHPKEILDLGSGPGNSTALLKERFPDAHVVGGDKSDAMIEASLRNHPDIPFVHFDAQTDFDKYYCHFDLVFSNACIQWVPDHEKLISDMMRSIKPKGILAVQIPYNDKEPIKEIIREVTTSLKWKELLKPRSLYSLSEREYYLELFRHSSEIRLWKTTYYHVLKNYEAILEWYSSTGLKPYLDQLPLPLKEDFKADILKGIRERYPKNPDGTVLFLFPRLFFVARKKDMVVKNKYIPKADLDMMKLDHFEHHMGG